MIHAEMIPLDKAFRIMDERLAGINLPVETIPVRHALGRILATDYFSKFDLPAFNKSAMDGYAIYQGDERREYQVYETIAAGQAKEIQLSPGTAVKVMTGAPVPEGTGKVVRIEDTRQLADHKIEVLSHADSPNICWKSEDVKIGQRVMSAGLTLDALAVANMISCGITEAKVFHRLRVAIISTGDEIVDTPEEIVPGKIINANGPLLASASKTYGYEVTDEIRVSDDKNETIKALRKALVAADMTLVSGGVSVGDFDFIAVALQEIGADVHFSSVAVKPGKWTTFATVDNRLVLGLPGNPVSSYLMFLLFAKRAAALVSNQQPCVQSFPMPLNSTVKRKKTERMEFRPCRVLSNGTLEGVEYHGSAHLTGLTEANGLFVIPAGVREIAAGESIAFLPRTAFGI